MTEDYMPLRLRLPDDYRVAALAARLRRDPDLILGKLVRFWAWANANTADGQVPGLDGRWLDRTFGCRGLAAGLVAVGWLVITAAGLQLPEWETWNGKGAKRRLQEAARKATKRATDEATELEDEMRTESGPPSAKCPPPERTNCGPPAPNSEQRQQTVTALSEKERSAGATNGGARTMPGADFSCKNADAAVGLAPAAVTLPVRAFARLKAFDPDLTPASLATMPAPWLGTLMMRAAGADESFGGTVAAYLKQRPEALPLVQRAYLSFCAEAPRIANPGAWLRATLKAFGVLL